ncbi:hypothetical protein [Gemmata sp.]|uniref:hypothetical protein n=1 Tax=Gemmata sp. TaxID=1914242 RepID=UPI003F6F66E5
MPFRRLLRVWDYLLGNAATPKPSRGRLAVEQMEERTMLTAVPLLADGGGTWVKVDTLTVATRTNQNVSTGVQSAVALEAGQTYLAVAHGMARIATDTTGFADAEFIRYNKSTGPQDGSSPGYAWNNHGVRLAGVPGGDTTGNLWGGYQSDHQYVKTFVGQGTKVTGYYSDLPGYYGDNSGTLQVDLYAAVPTVAVTAATNSTEGGAGTFTLTRSGGNPSQPLTAYFALGGTASATWDYTVGGATYDPARQRYTVTFPAGAATAVVTLPTVDGDCPELDETVDLTVLPDDPRYAVSATQARKTLTVADNDVTPDMVAPGAVWTDDGSSVYVANTGATWLRAEVVAPGWVRLSPVACGETGPAIWNDYAASVTGLDGYDGDATWEGDAGSLTLTAAGGIHDVTLHAAEDSLGNRSGRVTLHAGHDVGAVRAGEVVAITSGGTVGDVTAEWSVGDVSARSRVGAVLVVQGSVDGDVASATGSVGDVTASGDIKGSVTAAGDIGHVKAGDTLSASLTAGGSIASITVKDPEAAGETPLLEHGTLDQVGWGVYSVDATTDRYEPVGEPGTGPRDAVDGKTVGGLTGTVSAGGNIGPVVVFGPVSKSVTAGGTVGVPIAFEVGGVWVKGAVSGDITAGAGGVTVRGWDLVEGAVTAPGAVAVWAVGDVSGAVTSTAKAVTVGTFGDVTAAVTAAGEVDVRAAGSVGRDSLATSGTGSLIQSTGDAVLVWSGGTVAAPLSAKKYVAVYGKQGVVISGTVKSSEGDVSINSPDGGISGGSSLIDQLRVEAGRNIELTAGKGIKQVSVAATKNATISAGTSIADADVRAGQNVWASARGGDLDGTFVASEGWSYAWAYTDLKGKVSAKGQVSATAWNDLSAQLTSSEDGVEAFAGRDLTNAVTGKWWVDIEARGKVSGTVTAGDVTAFGGVIVRAGGDITGKVISSGNTELATAASVSGGAEATGGWLYVTANAAITGDYKAGEAANLWSGGTITATVTTAGDLEVKAGGTISPRAGGFRSTGGDVRVWTGGDMSQNVDSTGEGGDIFVEAAGSVTGTTSIKAGKDVEVLANGDIDTGVSVEGEWVADVRSANGEVKGAVTTRKKDGWLTDPASPAKQRLDIIDKQIADLLVKWGQTQSDSLKTLYDQQIAQLRAEREALAFGDKPLNYKEIPAARVDAMVRDGLAKRSPSGTYEGSTTEGYVVIADTIGDVKYVLVLEPFRYALIDNAGGVPDYGGPVDPDRYTKDPDPNHGISLIGNPNALAQVEFYKVVDRITVSASTATTPGTPEGWRKHVCQDTDLWLNRIQAVVFRKKAAQDVAIAQTIDFGMRLLPLVGAVSDFLDGNYTEAAISLAGDAAMITGFGAAFKARKCVTAGKDMTKLVYRASVGTEAAIAGFRLGQGIDALADGDTSKAYGHFGDATLRLFGLSAQSIAWLRNKPKCFVAGTLVHTASGPKPIEEVIVGDRVWAYDRQAGNWQLREVTHTHERRSDILNSVTFADGSEVTGTHGHPFWVIEGAKLTTRPTGDHGHAEGVGRTPGCWVAMGSLVPGDVILTMNGRVSRVMAAESRAGTVPVFNLSVEGLHSYAVGMTGVLVHNADPADYSNAAKTSTKAAATTPDKPTVVAPKAGQAPEVSVAGPTTSKGKLAPEAGTPKPNPNAPTVPVTPGLENITPGTELGKGGNKIVSTVVGDETKAVGVLKAGRPAKALQEEIQQIQQLKDAGLPTVNIVGTTVVGDRPAIVMDRFALGSKKVVENVNGKPAIVGNSSLLNQRSVQDLENIKRIMIEKKVKVDDLQFLIASDGRVVIADPLKVFTNQEPSKVNKRTIDLLIKVAKGES